MDFNNIDEIKKAGFVGFKKMSDLFKDNSAIPKTKGVYLVLNPNYKKKKPNICKSEQAVISKEETPMFLPKY